MSTRAALLRRGSDAETGTSRPKLGRDRGAHRRDASHEFRRDWGHWGAAGVRQSILNRSTKIASGEQQVTSSLTMASKVEETSEEAKGHKEAEDSMPSPRKTFKVRMVAVRSPTPANSHCCCHCVLTQVVKDMGGNVRQQSISHFPLEIDQCVLDVSSYLKEHAAADGLAIHAARRYATHTGPLG